MFRLYINRKLQSFRNSNNLPFSKWTSVDSGQSSDGLNNLGLALNPGMAHSPMPCFVTFRRYPLCASRARNQHTQPGNSLVFNVIQIGSEMSRNTKGHGSHKVYGMLGLYFLHQLFIYSKTQHVYHELRSHRCFCSDYSIEFVDHCEPPGFVHS
jgi:hypothetical protein